jgi:coiled-coil-helix-coiled-coil-helix domain-containing protein 10
MPRGSSRSSSSRSAPTRSAPTMRSAPPPAHKPAPARAPPPPAPAPAAAPPPAHAPSQGGGIMSGLASTVMQGMAFGTGSAIAHRAVGAVAGSMSGSGDNSAQQAQAPAQIQAPATYQGSCTVDLTAFNNCMRENNNNVTACDFYYQALQQCQASNNY